MLTGAGNQYYDAGTKTQFFRPGGSGSFSLNATADDVDTGVTHVAFPDVSGVSGWSGSTGGNDTTSPYASPADYTWTSGATAPGARSIVATNSVALTNSDTITLAADSAGPTGQSVTLTGPTAPYYGSASVSFTLADGNDGAGSGLDVSTRTVTRETGTLSGNSCTSFSPDAGTFTSPDTAVSAGHCYRYSFTIADKVGNISSAATATAKVDNGAPTVSVGTPTALTGAGNQYYDAGTKTLFFRSTGSGSFDLNATASDSDTAVDAVDFPTISSLSGWSGSTGGADTTSPYSSPTALLVELRRRGARRADRLRDRQGRELVLGHDHDRRRHERADRPVDHAHRRVCPLLRLELGRLQPCQRFGQRRRRRARPRLGHGDTRDRHALR